MMDTIAKEGNTELLCNIFPSNLIFDKPITDIDFFRVVEAIPKTQKYNLLGNIAYWIGRYENTPFASYFPSKDESFVIGFLTDGPKRNEYFINNVKVVYEGKQNLPNTDAGKRSLLELIYKIQRKKT